MYAGMHVCMYACMYVHIPERIEGAILRRIDIARTRPCFHEAHLCVCVYVNVFSFLSVHECVLC